MLYKNAAKTGKAKEESEHWFACNKSLQGCCILYQVSKMILEAFFLSK